MDSLSFAFAASSESNDHQARVQVNGADLLDMIAADELGLDPPELFAQKSALDGGYLAIGRCNCGERGCGEYGVQVTHDARADLYIWDTQTAVGARTFAGAAYRAAWAAGQADYSWEDDNRAAERLVLALDLSPLIPAGYEFHWVSARIEKSQIVLSVRDKARGRQRLFNYPYKDGPHGARAAILEALARKG
jgi:hypothetical protein